MVELKTAIEELRSGKIEFEYKSDNCCTTPGEILILLGRLAELEERIDKGEVIEAPCNKGDTVFWVDALNHISPIKVIEFTLGVRDERGCYYSHFGSSILLSEEEAKHRVELSHMRYCEECYKRSVSGGFVQGCDQGHECPKSAFKEKYAVQWRKEELARMEQEDISTCRRCYISHIRNSRREKLIIDCASCSGKHIVDQHRSEWDAEAEGE